ncbi:MAG: hypothetical protein ACI4T1_00490 [Christensenellales bacterium]
MKKVGLWHSKKVNNLRKNISFDKELFNKFLTKVVDKFNQLREIENKGFCKISLDVQGIEVLFISNQKERNFGFILPEEYKEAV